LEQVHICGGVKVVNALVTITYPMT
jgi:hypothetical protein